MPSDNRVKLLRSSNYFLVSNVENTVEFYENQLGFKSEYIAGNPAQFAICSRDKLAIMFRLAPDYKLIKPVEKQGGTWDAFFWTNQAEKLHSEFKAKKADVVYGPLVQEAYNMLEFAIRDCDGHILGFGQQL